MRSRLTAIIAMIRGAKKIASLSSPKHVDAAHDRNPTCRRD